MVRRIATRIGYKEQIKQVKEITKMKNNKGFSLVELIIVIAIMAVLIGVLAPQFIKYVERSRESTDLQNIEEVKTAVETYVADHGEDTLPATIKVTWSNGPSGVINCTDVDVTEYGIDSSGIKTKSSKWTGGTLEYSYSTTTYTWTAPTGVHADFFNADGTNVSGGGASSSS